MPSLSQTYRPRRFADVTGQSHVTDTLRAELATGNLGHAFLFSGPRGVGKTTCARILAKALGCAQPEQGEPCGTCSSCQVFQEGRSLDVIEIDAATHTGVDMIREVIVEHVRFAPVGKRKVYILDEAHMLTSHAWNALLKTLEEPPAYAFFVFATTEWHKVPPTILSRCQRFEFKRIQPQDMIARLAMIAEGESWRVEPEVLTLIASRAEGCLRDAETLFSQVGSLAEEGMISFATAGLVIPVSSYDHALSWLEGVQARSLHQLHEQLLAWQDAGISFVTLLDDTLELIKRLLQAQADATLAAQWEAGTDEDRRLAKLIPAWTGSDLRRHALELMERRRDLNLGMDPVFICLLAANSLISEEVSTPPPPPPPPPSLASDVAPSVAPRVVAAAPVAAPIPAPAPAPAVVPVPAAPAPVATPAPTPMPVVAPSPAPAVPTPVTPVVATPLAEAPAPVAPTEANPVPSGTMDIVDIRRRWGAFIRVVESKNHSLPFILKISKPERIDGSTLIICFPYPFHRDKVVGDGKNLRLITECAREAFAYPTLSVDGIVVTPEESQDAGTSGDVAGNIMKAFGGSIVESSA